MSAQANAEVAPAWLEIGASGITVNVVARPGSSRKGIVREQPDGLVIALHSRRDRGEANAELIDYLARLLRIPRSSIEIIRGAATRRKRLRIATANRSEMAERCALLLKPQ